ncbi:MAG: kinase [Candidatus Omnitrophica bacterium]|nr:kinase [Candidatus Omnitrophota bacterium]
MIMSRTPFRISFFGGGTDYPSWYKENGGVVLSTTIDKYCYISCRRLPPFFEYKHRIVYSKSEHANEVNEIIHPAVREVFRFLNISEGLEIHHDGDLPARSGLGSSSAFTVGLLHALYALRGQMVTKQRLAQEAIYIEQEMIKENVGSQDQISAAFGGFRKINFNIDNSFEVTPVILAKERLRELQAHSMLFFTGFSRIASDIAKEQINRIPKMQKELSAMSSMVNQAVSILDSDTDIGQFGKLLHDAWRLKRSFSVMVSNNHINEIYDVALGAGALGGKILGAGGGGFMLIHARPEDQPRIKERLKKLLMVPFQFEETGSQIVIYNPDGF